MPSHSPMLAIHADESNYPIPALGSIKLDGVRAIVLPKKFYEEEIAFTKKAWPYLDQNKKTIVVSRTFKPIPNFYIQRMLDDERFLFHDGELTIGEITKKDCLQTTQSGVMTLKEEPNFHYYAFDLYTKGGALFEQRITQLCKTESDFYSPLKHHKLSSLDEVKFFEESIVSLGHEGIILRKPNAKYKNGRSTVLERGMIKVKRWLDRESPIVSFEPLLINHNLPKENELGLTKRSSHEANLIPASMLGVLILADGTRVGSGFTDKQRVELWNMRDSLLGQNVTYKFLPAGTIERPRSPIFKTIRLPE